MTMQNETGHTAAILAGILLTGYGLLISLRVLAHESLIIGVALLVIGPLLIWAGRPIITHSDAKERTATYGQRLFTIALGMVSAGGVLTYNLLAQSGLTIWEIGIVFYGACLLIASAHLDHRIGPARIGSIVAWSLPLVAAPLGMFALDSAIKSQTGSSPIDPFLSLGLVTPMAWSLGLLGFDTSTIGKTVLLGTPRGNLALGIGLVCAGFQPGILFIGVLGLHAWRRNTPPKRLAAYLVVGLIGVYFANLMRLVALAVVGYHWGGAALQTAHAHLGWILFFGWIMLFWWFVLRRIEGRSETAPESLPVA